MSSRERARPRVIQESMELGERTLLSWAYEKGELTKEFKKWFGRSVLKDRTGKPLIFYHGTSADFLHFDESKMQEMGFHFGSAHAAGERSYEDGGRVYPVVIAMRNPLRLRDSGGYANEKSFSLERIRLQLVGEVSHSLCKRNDGECKQQISREVFAQRTETDMRAYLISKGFDGIIYRNEYEDSGSDSVIIFDMNQVRSAIDGAYLTAPQT